MNILLKAITATVLREHTPVDAVPLTLEPGDVVSVDTAHPDRPGYVWVNDGGISAGWVPLDILDMHGGVVRARETYCSAELTVTEGEVVRLMWEDPKHGAWWCENRHSERGWIRSDDLRVDPQDA